MHKGLIGKSVGMLSFACTGEAETNIAIAIAKFETGLKKVILFSSAAGILVQFNRGLFVPKEVELNLVLDMICLLTNV